MNKSTRTRLLGFYQMYRNVSTYLVKQLKEPLGPSSTLTSIFFWCGTPVVVTTLTFSFKAFTSLQNANPNHTTIQSIHLADDIHLAEENKIRASNVQLGPWDNTVSILQTIHKPLPLLWGPWAFVAFPASGDPIQPGPLAFYNWGWELHCVI